MGVAAVVTDRSNRDDKENTLKKSLQMQSIKKVRQSMQLDSKLG